MSAGQVREAGLPGPLFGEGHIPSPHLSQKPCPMLTQMPVVTGHRAEVSSHSSPEGFRGWPCDQEWEEAAIEYPHQPSLSLALKPVRAPQAHPSAWPGPDHSRKRCSPPEGTGCPVLALALKPCAVPWGNGLACEGSAYLPHQVWNVTQPAGGCLLAS